MIRLHHGTGSQEIQLGSKRLQDSVWAVTKSHAIRLLEAHGPSRAAELLRTIPFDLYTGTNGFGDEFCVLYYLAQPDRYVEIAEQTSRLGDRYAYEQIAYTMAEVGFPVRFIALDVTAEQGAPTVSTPTLSIQSAAVERALADAEHLIQGRGAPSGVDRIHTALHGYLRAVAASASISASEDADITALFSLLRERHPAMRIEGPRADDVLRIIRSIATILDTLNPLRNRATTAHPNEVILGEAEAMLVINCVKSVLHFLNSKLS